VHDARPAGAADAGHLGITVEEMMGQGAGGPAGAGVDGEARRLVEHHQVRVLVEQAEVAPLGHDAVLPGHGRVAVDTVAGGDGGRGLRRPAVDLDEAFVDPLVDLIAGDVEIGGHVAVEPLACRVRIDGPGWAQSAAVAVAGAS
jgi:hypothetical protein